MMATSGTLDRHDGTAGQAHGQELVQIVDEGVDDLAPLLTGEESSCRRHLDRHRCPPRSSPARLIDESITHSGSRRKVPRRIHQRSAPSPWRASRRRKPTASVCSITACPARSFATRRCGAMIAKNRREAVMGVKALLLRDMGCYLEERWANERDYTTSVVRGAKAEVEGGPSAFLPWRVLRCAPCQVFVRIGQGLLGVVPHAAHFIEPLGRLNLELVDLPLRIRSGRINVTEELSLQILDPGVEVSGDRAGRSVAGRRR